MLDKPISITFTISDIFYLILFIAGIILTIYLILGIRELYIILKSFNIFYNINQENLNSLVDNSTKLLNNFNNCTSEISNGISGFAKDISSISPVMQTIFNLFKTMFKI